MTGILKCKLSQEYTVLYWKRSLAAAESSPLTGSRWVALTSALTEDGRGSSEGR